MGTGDWISLLGVMAAILVPGVIAWIAVWVKLSVLQALYEQGNKQILDQLHVRSEEISELRKSVRELARSYNHQEGRLFMQDRILAKIISTMGLEIQDEDWTPKRHPNLRPEA